MTARRALMMVAGTVLVVGGCGQGAAEDPGATETVTETVTVTETATPSATPPPETSVPATPDATDAEPPSGAPRTYAEALARFKAPGQERLAYRRFTTADGNIYCLLSDKALAPGCEIADGGVEDPTACAGAASPVVSRIELQGGRARPVCGADSIRADMPDLLAQGDVAEAGDLQCLAEAAGVTCLSVTSEAGFFLGRGQYVVLGDG